MYIMGWAGHGVDATSFRELRSGIEIKMGRVVLCVGEEINDFDY
jgi:hypothetical protein